MSCICLLGVSVSLIFRLDFATYGVVFFCCSFYDDNALIILVHIYQQCYKTFYFTSKFRLELGEWVCYGV